MVFRRLIVPVRVYAVRQKLAQRLRATRVVRRFVRRARTLVLLPRLPRLARQVAKKVARRQVRRKPRLFYVAAVVALVVALPARRVVRVFNVPPAKRQVGRATRTVHVRTQLLLVVVPLVVVAVVVRTRPPDEPDQQQNKRRTLI